MLRQFSLKDYIFARVCSPSTMLVLYDLLDTEILRKKNKKEEREVII